MSFGVVFILEISDRLISVKGECTQVEHYEPRGLAETAGGASRKQ